MADEKIEVVYKELVPGVGGRPGVHHKYVVYTDSDGNQFYARGGPKGGLVSGLTEGDAVEIRSGEYREETPDWEDENEKREVVDEDGDLSTEWSQLLAALHALDGYRYLPTMQNSNTVVDEALRDLGYDLPVGDSVYWSPGSLGPGMPFPGQLNPFWALFGALPPGLQGTREPYLSSPLSHESPLVLDLDGNGIQTTTRDFLSAQDGSIYFDLNADGFAERTNWVAGGDGLLAWDRNSNGSIDDGSELFGNTSAFADGFAALADLDSNSDDHITSADADWASLRVWVDADGDGVTDSGELVTLSSLLITDIDLGATPLYNNFFNDNLVSATSTFTMNGNAEDIADVWFRTDMMDTQQLDAPELAEVVYYLPTLRGAGTLPSLSVAMTADSDLLGLVLDFVDGWSVSRFADEAALDSDLRDILFKWAEVEGVSPTSRGLYVDARELAFLEKFFGQSYSDINIINHNDNPGGYGPGAIPDVFKHLFDLLKAGLVVQLEGSSLFEAPAYYLPNGEVVAGALSQAGIDALEAEAALAPDAEDYWLAFTRFITAIRDVGSFDTAEEAALNAAIHDSLPLSSWDALTSEALEFYGYPSSASEFSNYRVGTWQEDNLNSSDGNDLVYGMGADDEIDVGDGNNTAFGGYGDDYIVAGDGDDRLLGEAGVDVLSAGDGEDHLDGGAGNDQLYGGAGDDELVGGTGNEELFGGTGDDTYVINMGDGVDIISEALEGTAGYDTILFGDSVELTDLSFFRSGWNLVIQVGSTGTITLPAHFSDAEVSSNLQDEIDVLRFADGSTLSLSSGFSFTGTSGSDSLYGTLHDDVLDGGAGSDLLVGGAGADTFSFAPNQIGSSDTASDFSLLDGDKIDISAVIEFDPFLHTNITDYVQITTSGSNSLLSVDVDGGADNFVQIATLSGVTGLTDEAALVTSGTLITAPDSKTFSGLAASYFTLGFTPWDIGSVNFNATPTYKEIVSDIDHNASSSTAFYTGGPLDNFAVGYDGYLNVEEAGLYTLSLRSDDGSALWLDGVKVINNDGLHGAQTISFQKYLTAGAHALDVRYIEAGGDQKLQLWWNGADTDNATEIMDGAALSHGGALNTIPFAYTDLLATDIEAPAIIDVVSNDFDADEDEVTVLSVTQGGHGTVAINLDGTLTYTPDDSYTGLDEFTYTIADGNGGTDIGKVSVIVAPSSESYSDNFESAAFGWEDPQTNNAETGSFTKFLGRFGGNTFGQDTAKIFSLEEPHDRIVIEFDFYKLDSWDSEHFEIYINNSVILSDQFGNTPPGSASGTFEGGSWKRTEITTGDLGFDNYDGNWDDGIYHYEVTLNSAASVFKLGFGSTLDGTTNSDEAFGIDNVFVGQNPITGTSGNDTLSGTTRRDAIYGLAGNDTITGDVGQDVLIGGTGQDSLTGGAGDDLYRFVAGFGEATTLGADTIYEDLSGGIDKIDLSTVLFDDMKMWVDASQDLHIRLTADADDEIVIAGSTASGGGTDVGSRVEQLLYYNGGVLDMSSSLLLLDTDDAHTIHGSAGGDTVGGAGGNDTIYGFGGNDFLLGQAGSDTVHGGDGADHIISEVDGDILYGDDGADKFTLYGTTPTNGGDTIMDFDIMEGDQLDVAGILYNRDPLTEAITDFIQITTSGGNSIVSLDVDGGANSFVQIATLTGITGLTDEAALVTNGTLIAA